MIIKTIKSVDKVVPYNDYGSPADTGIRGDCECRSVRFSQLTGKDLDFGMVYMTTKLQTPIGRFHIPLSKTFVVYTYHVWCEDDNFIYDSDRQFQIRKDNRVMVERFGLQETMVDKKAVIFDISRYRKSLMKHTNPKVFNKVCRKILEPYFKKAEQLGVDFIYFSGLAIDIEAKNWNEYYSNLGNAEFTVQILDENDFNHNMDYRELQLEKYFNKIRLEQNELVPS